MTKKVCINSFCDKKKWINSFCNRKVCLNRFCNKTSVLKSFLQLSRLSGSFPGIPNFPGYPEIFWIIRKICSLSGNVSGYPETFQIIRKISSLSGKYPAYLENIQPIQKISSLSGNFPAYPETFQAIRKLSRLSRNFPDHPENIQPIRKISRQSGKNPDYLEIFQRVRKLLSAILRVTRKNFPDAQKLSGWQCHPATQVFGTLALTTTWPGTRSETLCIPHWASKGPQGAYKSLVWLLYYSCIQAHCTFDCLWALVWTRNMVWACLSVKVRELTWFCTTAPLNWAVKVGK